MLRSSLKAGIILRLDCLKLAQMRCFDSCLRMSPSMGDLRWAGRAAHSVAQK
jgi:hypothetical protein